MRVAYAQNYQLGGIRPEKVETSMSTSGTPVVDTDGGHPISDGDRIAAEGVPLTLADGRTVRVRYSLRSLRAIEKKIGSINNLQTLIQTDDDGRPVGEIIDPLVELLEAGLLHEGLSADDLLDLIAPSQIQTAYEVAARALTEAMPEQPEQAPLVGNGQKTATELSRGRRSSTP